jgi:glucose/arabinose dehydrogenase
MNLIKKYFILFGLTFSTVIFSQHHEADYELETIVEGLDHPWGAVFLSEDEILVTELSGALRVVKSGKLLSEPVSGVPNVLFAGQGGLSDVALHPNFKKNRLVYLSFSESDDEQKNLNTLRVIRGRLENNSLSNIETIFKATPLRKTAAHYGARLLFISDGTLLITSGDGFNYRERAQYLDNHFGKILRVNDDGSIPDDNPYVTTEGALPEIWSYGHRNLQGISMNSNGSLIFAHEHGPMGGDELNVIEPKNNYGWPAITYGIDYSGALISPFKEKLGMEQPQKYWVPSIAPSGMTFYDGDLFPHWKGSLFISALVPGDVRRLTLDGKNVVSEEILFNKLGRIRNIISAPDGSIIIATDGKNGKLIRVTPKK